MRDYNQLTLSSAIIRSIKLSLIVFFVVSSFAFANDEFDAQHYIKRIINAKDTYPYRGVFNYERPDYKSEVYVHQQVSDEGEVHHWVREKTGDEGFLKINGKVSCVTKAYNNRFRANTILQSIDEEKIENILRYYDVTLSKDESMTAGLSTYELIFKPKAKERYIYKLVFDKKTFVPLRFVFFDHNQKLLEQGFYSQFTYLAGEEEVKPLHNCQRVAQRQTDTEAVNWTIDWIPKGFMFFYRAHEKEENEHLVYGDGVVSFSVFIEPLTDDALVNIQKHSGATTLVSRKVIGSNKQSYLVIVVGEIPASTALHIASSVHYAP